MRAHAPMNIGKNLTNNAIGRNGGHFEPTTASRDKSTQTVAVSHIGILNFGLGDKSSVTLPWNMVLANLGLETVHRRSNDPQR